MRYQNAVVLSTLAVGQAAAAAANRHASFHARRTADKRNMNDVNWDAVAYDFSNVDWKTVDYSKPKATPTPQPSPAAASSAPAKAAAASSQAPAPAQASPSKAPVVSPSTPETPSTGKPVTDLTAGISLFSDFMSKNKVVAGKNAKSSAGGIWIGDDGSYKASFTNDGSDTVAVVCWDKSNMFINTAAPSIFVTLAGQQSVTVSMKEGFSGACGPATPSSGLLYGLLNESILEFTAGSGANGAFDVSREINMKGLVLSAKGSKCTSGVSGGAASCVFGCRGGADTCGKGKADSGTGVSSYNIALGSAASGACMIGTDPYTGDPSGGCQMGDGSEHMQVTIFGHRDWPAVSF